MDSIEQPKYVMSSDTCGEFNSYCLARIVDGKVEIILNKVIISEKEFKEEVNNLVKYFNATDVHEG